VKIINGLSVDVEDYFQVEAFSSTISFSSWDTQESRVERNTKKVLKFLEEEGIRATFFCIGWVAKRFPGLIKEISQNGHEIASHGFFHKPIWKQTPKEFREDVRSSKRILEDLIGKKVIGYRAPTYSITKKTLWALEILSEEGFVYDSSIFPIKHDLYGMSSAPRFPFKVKDHFLNVNSDLVEVPMSTLSFLKIKIPVAGGGYFRAFPFWFIRFAFWFINSIEKRSVIFYIHPWEFDPDQPKIKGLPFKSRLRHYINLNKTSKRFKKLISIFKFNTISNIISSAN